MEIEKLEKKHWPEVAEIYQAGIDTKNATFRTQIPSWKNWNTSHHQHSRFVVVENRIVLGWCAISLVSNRKEYNGVAEVSVYVSLNSLGKGLGSLLMRSLIKSSEENGIWTLYSSLFPENKSSINLHLKNSFRCIGKREKIAQQDGIWRDTVLFERRSKML
ncbi:MAG: GNAT family N-acetyltransferase [Polaribacter sp.]|jgi:L-amino acid N-acyltransferase YncA|nr:GNAT family N-acetyltransferase [Polaribacter sp.]MDG2073404.1 GNAT family N-acetyltransferase [Polaribacter sp.]